MRIIIDIPETLTKETMKEYTDALNIHFELITSIKFEQG